MAHLLGTQNVGALAGSRKLLEGVTVGLEDGSRVGILGPNGAGKSTLAQVIAGTLRFDSGRAQIGERVVDDAATFVPARRRGVGDRGPGRAGGERDHRCGVHPQGL